MGDKIKKAELEHEHVGETSTINIKEVVCLGDIAGCSENLMQRYAHDDESDFWYIIGNIDDWYILVILMIMVRLMM